MQETNFDRLLHRYLHRELTPEEHEKFSAWLSLLQQENTQDLELSPAAKEQLFQKITSNTNTAEDVIALYPRKSRMRRVFSYRWTQIAATVALMLIATLVVTKFAFDASGNRALHANEKMILNDGTIVWLTPSSNFNYYEKDGARFADFAGDALFEVAKNPNSPFTITCGNINVQIVGTSFTLKADQGHIELSVLTGKVHVTSTADEVGVDVNPNEKLIYSAKGVIELATIAATELNTVFSNTEYNLKFQGTRMDKVIEGISRKFEVTIVVQNQKLNECHITADFTDQSLEETLSILTDLLDVSYHITGKQVVLSGTGC